MKKISRIATICFCVGGMLTGAGCSGRASADSHGMSGAAADGEVASRGATMCFNSDSAYAYVARQVEFGPRVPNTEAHRLAGDWLAGELRRHGAEVHEQRMELKTFDGVTLKARNIMGRFNPEAGERVLLLAHWDCRPWADEDPDEANRQKPVDGANDGASGVGVLLEIARQIGRGAAMKHGVDILFVDAEDWGTAGDDDSWAMGTRYFAQHPVIPGYNPKYAVLLDMVGGEGAEFAREYFSEESAPGVNAELWAAAAAAGHSDRFVQGAGPAVNDDHLELIKAGIPAIDLIEYTGGGFNRRWHTAQDNMEGISRETLGAVGESVMQMLRE